MKEVREFVKRMRESLEDAELYGFADDCKRLLAMLPAEPPEGGVLMPERSTVEIQEVICDHMFADWRGENEKIKASCRSEATDIYDAIRATLSQPQKESR